MDEGIKKNIWSVMEDFSTSPGDKDFNTMKSQYSMFVVTRGWIHSTRRNKIHQKFKTKILPQINYKKNDLLAGHRWCGCVV
jgi:hypothetical protein